MTAYELRRHLADMHNIELRGVAYVSMVAEHDWLHHQPDVDHTHPDDGDTR